MVEHPHPIEPATGNGHEHTDANTGSLFKFGVALLVLIAAVLGLMWGLLKLYEAHPPDETTQPSALAEHGVLPPAPRLQSDPTADMIAFGHREDSLLTSYGWVDRGRQLVRVPIDTAIAMVVRKGLPLDNAAMEEVSREGSPGRRTPQEGGGGSGQISGTTR